MYAWHPPRALSAASSVAIVALIGVLLLLGLRAQQVIRQSPSPISLTLSPQPQPRRSSTALSMRPCAARSRRRTRRARTSTHVVREGAHVLVRGSAHT